ncbi:Methyl-CpG-binding domain-containing protein 9 [Apostasia shenzhenica]|uniref:Methyl-CpG-binding domain-containing protein 9 n=1 Tax=Apostasia shenzhenica TaxID=1088818 RepID=A0A2I0AS46_9ASPA|nr:Methyl-CpG-binding domain-containing protein 9 [Apostasia shenzhenica]
MSSQENCCNVNVKLEKLSREGLITYRRRKRVRTDGHELVGENHDVTFLRNKFARANCHWGSTLECMLEGTDIKSCILDALAACPDVFPSYTNMADVPMSIAQSEGRYIGNCEVQNLCFREDVTAYTAADVPKIKIETQADMNVNTAKCQKVFQHILCSEYFALLCKLLCESFQNMAVVKLLDFSSINSKLKNGDYEQLPVSFVEDIQQFWSKFQKIGQELQLLSSNLSKMSRASYAKEVGEVLILDGNEQKFEENLQGSLEQKNSVSSDTTAQLTLCESDRSNKPDQSEASYLFKVNACRQCGLEALGEQRLTCCGCEAVYHISCVEPGREEVPNDSWYCSSCDKDKSEMPEAVTDDLLEVFVVDKDISNDCKKCDDSSDQLNKTDQSEASCQRQIYTCRQCSVEVIGENSLICDECEAMYHFTCAEPAVQEIPLRNWYCSSCQKDRREVIELVRESNQDELHENCAVCDRLEFSEAKKDMNESKESSILSPDPSTTALGHLCKVCGTCEDEDRKFLVCDHSYCPYKYYHIRCLRNSQIASQQQLTRGCWYCPSCLCRSCFFDKDDDKIVLCDGCDEAHHTYCMKPPRASIPKGQWYCIQCNIARAKEGMRRYEQSILQKHGKKEALQVVKKNWPMDILLNAVDKVSFEEQRATK